MQQNVQFDGLEDIYHRIWNLSLYFGGAFGNVAKNE
jgi:hypothetical protein